MRIIGLNDSINFGRTIHIIYYFEIKLEYVITLPFRSLRLALFICLTSSFINQLFFRLYGVYDKFS